MITQKKLKELLHYDPDTGIFTNRITRGRAGKGKSRGSITVDGYMETCIEYNRIYCHQLAFLYMTGNIPDEIDHKNRIRNNNKWCNLRAVTSKQNSQNMKLHKHNTSGVSGIDYDKRRNKWRVRIGDSTKKNNHIGYYVNFTDATIARKKAEHERGYSISHGGIK